MPRTRIGVTTEASVQSAPTSQSVPSGLFQVAGITVKGPLNYTGIIRNLSEYSELFGGRAPYVTVYDVVRSYFQEGGSEVAITRVVGPNATNGSVTIQDAAATPADTLVVEVLDPGPHTADYQAVVTENTDTTFNLTVLDSTTGRNIVTFQRAESTADLASLALGNEYVKISALAAGTPPAPGTYNLSAGTDDRAGILASTYGTALDAHKGIRGGIAVACPGQHPSTIAPVLGEHCANHKKIGLLDVPEGTSLTAAKTLGDSLLGTAYGSYLSMPIYPSIRVPDGNDRTRLASPVGYAAAHRSITHRVLSYAAAVAGPRVKTLWNFTPSVRLSEDDINDLNESGINGIQSGVREPYLNNWSSLSNEPGLYDLNVRDTMNNLTVLLELGFQQLIWKPNDGRETIRSEAQAIVDGVMAPLVRGGYLFPSVDMEGSYLDSGYTVSVEDIRTSGQAAPYDRIQVSVGVRLSPTLRHIHIPIRSVDLRSAL